MRGDKKNKIKFSEMLNKIKNSENTVNKITTNVNMLVNPKNLSTSNISKFYKNLSTSNISKFYKNLSTSNISNLYNKLSTSNISNLYNKLSSLSMMNLYKSFSASNINKLYKNFYSSNINKLYKNFLTSRFTDVYKGNSNFDFNNFYNSEKYLSLVNKNRENKPLRLKENHLKNIYSQCFLNEGIKILNTAPSVFSTANVSSQSDFNKNSEENRIFPQSIFNRGFVEKNISLKDVFDKKSMEKTIFPKEVFDKSIVQKNVFPSRIFSKNNEISFSGIYKKSLFDNNVLRGNFVTKGLSSVSEENIKFKFKDIDKTITQYQRESGNINISPNINVELKPQNTITDFNRIWLEIGNRLNSELSSSACGIH